MAEKTDLTLHNLYSFIYGSRTQNPVPVRLRQDGIIETDYGWFRPVYSPSTRCVSLFYARHPDHLRVGTEMDNGCLDLVDKDRLYLAGTFKILHSKRESKNREWFDLDWVQGHITKVISDIGRVFFEQANIHQILQHMSASAHVNYHATRNEKSGLTQVSLTSHAHPKHLLADAPERVFMLEQMKAAGHLIARRHPPVALLTVGVPSNGDLQLSQKTEYEDEGAGSLILADSAERRLRVQQGLDPIKRGERPLLTFYRAKETFINDIEELVDTARHDWKKFAREFGERIAMSVFGGGFVESIKDKAIHALFQIGVHVPSSAVSKEAQVEWGNFVITNHSSVKSDLYDLLPKPNLEHYGDWGAFNPAKHDVHIGLPSVPVNDDHTFDIWLKSQFLALRDTAIRSNGKDCALIDPRNLEFSDYDKHINIVRFKGANGVQLYLDPEKKNLYAYYHQPEYFGGHDLQPDNKELHIPRGSAQRFEACKVWAWNIDDINAPMKKIDFFEEFKPDIRIAAGSDNLSPPLSERVPDYAIERDEPPQAKPPAPIALVRAPLWHDYPVVLCM